MAKVIDRGAHVGAHRIPDEHIDVVIRARGHHRFDRRPHAIDDRTEIARFVGRPSEQLPRPPRSPRRTASAPSPRRAGCRIEPRRTRRSRPARGRRCSRRRESRTVRRIPDRTPVPPAHANPNIPARSQTAAGRWSTRAAATASAAPTRVDSLATKRRLPSRSRARASWAEIIVNDCASDRTFARQWRVVRDPADNTTEWSRHPHRLPVAAGRSAGGSARNAAV